MTGKKNIEQEVAMVKPYRTVLDLATRSLMLGVVFAILLAAVSSRLNAKEEALPGLGKTTSGNYLVGRHAQVLAKPEAAIVYYRSALKKNPDNIRLLRRIFTLLVAEGRVAEALPVAKRIDAQSEENGNLAKMTLALADIKAREFNQADARLAKLPEVNLNAFSLPLIKAWVRVGQNRTDEALKILSKKSSNQGVKALFGVHRALIAEFAGRNDVAEAAYKEAQKINKQPNLRLTLLFGTFYESTGQSEKARALYDGYKKINSSSVMFDSAYERLKTGKKPRPNVVSSVEGVGEALFSLSSAIRRQGVMETVIFARLAIFLKPDFTIARLLLAETLDSDKRYEDANRIYRAIAADPAYAWTARLRIAGNLDAIDKSEEAVRELRTMSDENVNRFDALYRLGNILRRRKKYKEATAAYAEAKDRIPNLLTQHWTLLYFNGIAHERLKQWPQAEAEFLKALELRPDQALVLNYLGYSWVEQGQNVEKARKMIEKAVKQRPRDGYIVDSLGWVLYRLGDLKGAVKQLERAVELKPEDPTINDHLGDIYWKVGRRNEARFQWERSLTLDPEKDMIPKIKKKLESGL